MSKPGFSNLALLNAVNAGIEEDARAALAAGADPDCDLGNGETPFTRAAQRRHEAVCMALLDGGASIQRSPGRSLLFDVTWSEPLTSRLLAAGLDASERHFRSGYNPVYSCASQGSVPVLELLLKAGADADTFDTKNPFLTAVSCAVRRWEYGMVSMLLDAGARLGPDGSSPPMHTLAGTSWFDIQRQHPNFEDLRATVRVLARVGGGVNETDDAGKNLLHHIVRTAPPDAVRILLEEGIDPEKRSRAGDTPARLAKRFGRPDNVAILDAWIARRRMAGIAAAPEPR